MYLNLIIKFWYKADDIVPFDDRLRAATICLLLKS